MAVCVRQVVGILSFKSPMKKARQSFNHRAKSPTGPHQEKTYRIGSVPYFFS